MAENEYIKREALLEAVRKASLTQFDWSEKVDLDEFEEVLKNIPAANVIEADKFASKIAGHSYYHGDKILTRLYCLKEGQEIEESIEPADVTEVVHGEWIEHSRTSAYENVVWYTCSLCDREEDDNSIFPGRKVIGRYPFRKDEA